jgi:uncharacterized protein YbjT (DUF2867 family)
MATILLTGATGFVGRRLAPTLLAAGHAVRGLSRDATRARADEPRLDWVEGDVGDEGSMRAALRGCDAAYFLVHAIGEGRHYAEHEIAAARCFARAAEREDVRRIVYLGGVAPAGKPSPHLQSRLDVGEALRAGRVPAVELRASMIIGHGSESWTIVRDLAARLPAMILPRWLRSRTQPVAIDDVVVALVRALDLPASVSRWYDVPGPEIMSGREILERTAHLLGHRRPPMFEVPLLSPRLSAHWVRLVTRANWKVAQQLVLGLTGDLLARDDHYWGEIGHPTRLGFEEAAHRALAEEHAQGDDPAGTWGAVERALAPREPQRG